MSMKRCMPSSISSTSLERLFANSADPILDPFIRIQFQQVGWRLLDAQTFMLPCNSRAGSLL
jgi:hypothetical protein